MGFKDEGSGLKCMRKPLSPLSIEHGTYEDSQGQIMALIFRKKSSKPFEVFTFLSETALSVPGSVDWGGAERVRQS